MNQPSKKQQQQQSLNLFIPSLFTKASKAKNPTGLPTLLIIAFLTKNGLQSLDTIPRPTPKQLLSQRGHSDISVCYKYVEFSEIKHQFLGLCPSNFVIINRSIL